MTNKDIALIKFINALIGIGLFIWFGYLTNWQASLCLFLISITHNVDKHFQDAITRSR